MRGARAEGRGQREKAKVGLGATLPFLVGVLRGLLELGDEAVEFVELGFDA